MLNNGHPDYFYTKEDIRIFHNTNFSKKDYDPNKPLIVFNYGLVCNNAHWQEQIPFFEELGYQILIHDYRSHYASSKLDDLGDCNFENITDDLFQLLESFDAKNILMIGHSMGVNVTLEFAKKYPELLKGIVLISGTVLPPQDYMFNSNVVDIVFPYIEWVTKAFPTAFNKLWTTSYLNPLARQLIYRGGFNTKKVPEEFIQTYMKRISTLPQNILLHLMGLMRDHDIINHLERIKVSALVMGGDQDQVIPNHLQYILHEHLPNSELYIIKDGSHVPQVDFPETINARIKRFLKKIY